MNLGTMKTALARIAGVDSTDPLVDWLNDAYHEVEDAYDWPFLYGSAGVNTVSGNTLLQGPPADLGKVIELKIIESGTAFVDRPALNYVPPIQYMEKFGYVGTASLGEPRFYTLLSGAVNLYPAPDAVYTLQLLYRKEFPDLVADVDVPLLPSRMHYTIVRGAAVTALSAESEEDRSEKALDAYQNSLERHISKYGGSKQGGQLQTVRDVMGYG